MWQINYAMDIWIIDIDIIYFVISDSEDYNMFSLRYIIGTRK